jgi:uncharacterized coiled-coil DUF342 family protein
MDNFNKICLDILKEAGEVNTDLGDEDYIPVGDDTDGAQALTNELNKQNEPVPSPTETQKALIDKFNKEIQDCIPSLSDVKTKLTTLFNLAVEYKETNPEIFSKVTEDIRKNTNNITTQIGSFEQILMLTKSNIRDKFIDNQKEVETPKIKPKDNKI